MNFVNFRAASAALRTLALLCLIAFAMPAAAQAPTGANHIQAELVAEGPPVPGETLEFAIHFKPEPGWHGYWSNPGDAGYGMRLSWRLPEGWKAGAPQYPVPQRLVIAGLMNHVYEGDYAVLVPLEVPVRAAVQNIVPIELRAEWLACTDEVCVPERGTFTLRLGQAMARDARFDRWRAALPPLLDRKASFAIGGEVLRLAIPLPASFEVGDPHVFVGEDKLVDYAARQRFYRKGNLLIAEIPRKGAGRAEAMTGIVELGGAGNGVAFEAEPGPVPSGGEPVRGAPATAPLWLLLGGALLGGLLLNVMPCVFPILSLKALTLARAGESAAQARREGLAYTAGVMLACLALGALMLALRAGGEEIGWAFQLQEPGVVVFLLVLAVAITANFAGLFELASLSFTGSGKPGGAFATGLLAAFVATPCTGPFMAAAMGAALLLPAPEALLLFAALGLGLALPFLLLGFVPPLRRLLPRPGKWMDTFRKIMAVPMGLTALALLWLAWRLGGAGLAVSCVILSIAVVQLLMYWRRGLFPVAIRLVAIALIVWVAAATFEPAAQRQEAGLIAAKPFSEAALTEARASGKPVFVWFTADWCLTCKVNEGVAIEREATRAAFERAGVVALVGDWTRRDPAITRFLTAQGAAGVPLYLWYAPGGEAQQLQQVLTPDSLVTLAKQAGAARAATPAGGTT